MLAISFIITAVVTTDYLFASIVVASYFVDAIALIAVVLSLELLVTVEQTQQVIEVHYS